MQKPKILIALFRLPYPATDGTRYKILNNLVSGLKKDFEVEFLVVSIKKYSQSDIEYLEKNYGVVHLFQHSKIAFAINSIPGILTGLPLQARAFHFGDAQKWLNNHIHKYDAVYIHEIRMTEFFIHYEDAMKEKFLVDFNDAISMNYRMGVTKIGGLKKIFYTWEGKQVMQYESVVLRSFKHFSIVSQVDKEYLLENAGLTEELVDFSVINHGAPISEQVALCDEQKIFFLGSLDYEPNRDALKYFIDEIWPSLSEAMPDLEFMVVGGGSVPREYKSIKNISFLGFVPSVYEAVKHCKALVAPVRFAGGTPSKIIETMGYGIPVITTPQGAAGIFQAESGKNMYIISEASKDAWVDAVKTIVSNDTERQLIAARARQLIVDQYSQEAAEQAFRNRFSKIIVNK